MVLKFCPNLSFMFQETACLLERYRLAKEAGFSGIECGPLYEFSTSQLVEVKEKNKLQQVLINVPTGDMTEGELGFAALPDKTHKFSSSFNSALDYAKALDCKMIHIMSGIVPKKTKLHYDTFEKNLRDITPILEKEGIVGLIEPINSISIPGYFLDNYEDAVDILKKIDSPNLRLQLDFFHLQHIKGNLTKNIANLMPYVGHIQIAQVPNRHEPNTSGEIKYSYIFSLLEACEYSGWIGLEYKPEISSKHGLSWLSKYGYNL